MAGSKGWTILEIAGELCGEAGELANICKKLRRSEMGVPGNKVSDGVLREKARGEIGDVLIVLMLVASKLGIDLHDAARDAFNAKSVEMGFPERFADTTDTLDDLDSILGGRPAHDCAGWDCANCHERDNAIRALLGVEQ